MEQFIEALGQLVVDIFVNVVKPEVAIEYLLRLRVQPLYWPFVAPFITIIHQVI